MVCSLQLLTFAAIFAFVSFSNSSNELFRALAISGLVTVVAALIGFYGCYKCLTHLQVVRTTKMKESPGQEALLIYFYFNFILFASFLLFGTWCTFFQDDASAFLDARWANKASWEEDFKGETLGTAKDQLRLVLSIAGTCAFLITIISFVIVRQSLKISMAFETIHTVVQVLNVV